MLRCGNILDLDTFLKNGVAWFCKSKSGKGMGSVGDWHKATANSSYLRNGFVCCDMIWYEGRC